MAMSFTKTKWMAITQTPHNDARLNINDHEIERVSKFNYLESIIEDDCNPKSAVRQNVKRVCFALIRIRLCLTQ